MDFSILLSKTQQKPNLGQKMSKVICTSSTSTIQQMFVMNLDDFSKSVAVKEDNVIHATHEEVLGAVQDSGRRVETLVKTVIQEDRLRGLLDTIPTFILPPSTENVKTISSD